MTTTKTKCLMVRLPMEAVDYVNELCTTQDMSACEIVRQIVVERMVNDRTNGEVAPFAHKLAPRPRGRPKNSEIEAEAEASDAPHVAGPVPARSAGMSLSSETEAAAEIRERSAAEIVEIKKRSKTAETDPNAPVFPGSKAEFYECLRLKTIRPGQYREPQI